MNGCGPRSAVWLKQNCGVRRGCADGFDMIGSRSGGGGGGGDGSLYFQK